MSKHAKDLLERISYKSSMVGLDIAFENMKNMHPSLHEEDIYTLAALSVNPAVSEHDREILKQCLKMKAEEQNKIYLKFMESQSSIRYEIEENISIDNKNELSDSDSYIQ